ncbi:MAG: TIM barrel protein [Methanomassiliicoccaceae archaeon]|nr:TIM barrel protein [Methanomassiliicoccaceae archaeon]
MRFGPAGYPQNSKDANDALNTIKEMGLDALEMEFVRGARISAEKAKEIGNRAKELDIRLSAHAPYFISFNSDTPETRVKSISWVIDTVRAAHNMGAYIIVIHAASYGKEPSKATDSVIDGLNKCKDIMDDDGIKDVILGLETMGRPATWGTLKEISKVMDSVPGTRPVLDVAHVHARYGGSLRTKEDMKELVDEFFPLAGDIPHFHISCIEYTAKGEKMHLPLSSADPDMSLLAGVLNDSEKDCTFICESPLLEQDALVFRNMFSGRSG